MIKINLLGDDTVRDTTGPLVVAGFGASLIVLLLACFLVYRSSSSSLESAQLELRESEITLARLKEKTKEVRELEARRDELQAITLSIATLKKSQEGPVRLLDDINIAVPERVWVRGIEIKGSEFRMTGIALSDSSLVTFLKSLEQSRYFDKLELIERASTPLAQVTSFNSIDTTYNWYVVEGDKDSVEKKISDLEEEGRALGLQFVHGEPTVKDFRQKDREGGSQEPVGIVRKASQYTGTPTMYAWESLQKVDGFKYSLEGRIRYTPKMTDATSTQSASTSSVAEVKG